MSNPFPAELRTMAFVPRWSIVWNIRPNFLAEHSYFVAVYALMIARLIKWNGPKDLLMFTALMHDAGETVTGDVVGPAKRAIVDGEAETAFVEANQAVRMPELIEALYELEDNASPQHLDEAETIVKAADRLDALLYQVVEGTLGNKKAGETVPGLVNYVEASWRNLPCDSEFLSMTWQTVVLPSINNHRSKGGVGV